MAAAKIFILAFAIIIWEVNSQEYGGSIFVNPLRPSLTAESPITSPLCAEESPIFLNPLRPPLAGELPIYVNPLSPLLAEESPIYVNPLRPPLAEESPVYVNPLTPILPEDSSIFVNPLRPPFDKESPIFVNPLRSSLAKNPSCPEVPSLNKLPITGSIPTELQTSQFKSPLFCTTSAEPLIPLTVKTYPPTLALDSTLDDSQSLSSKSRQDTIIPLSSEKPIKFYGPLSVEMNNFPLITTKPNLVLPFDTSSNIVEIESPMLPTLFSNVNQVTIVDRTPATNIIPTTRGLKDILNSSKNDLSSYGTFQSIPTKTTTESVATATNSITPSLKQLSPSTSTINVNFFGPNQVYQSPSNIFGCPENDPTCSFTSIAPLTLFDLPVVNELNTSSSISSNLASTFSPSSSTSSDQVFPNIVIPYISNSTPKPYEPFVKSSSTSLSSVNAQVSPDMFTSNVYGCAETDPLCSYTSIPPLSTTPTYQSSVNVAEATNLVSTGLGQASSASSSSVYVDSFQNGQANSLLPSFYTSSGLPSPSQSFVNEVKSTTSIALGSTEGSPKPISSTSSSTTLSSGNSQINSNPVNPFPPYVDGCLDSDPTCSAAPSTIMSTAKTSENVVQTTTSAGSNLVQGHGVSSQSLYINPYNKKVNPVFFAPYFPYVNPVAVRTPYHVSNFPQSLINIAKTPNSGLSNLGAKQVGSNSVTPNSSNIAGCPDFDPTCTFTSVAPVQTPVPCGSFYGTSEASSLISSGFEQDPSLLSLDMNSNAIEQARPNSATFFPIPQFGYTPPSTVSTFEETTSKSTSSEQTEATSVTSTETSISIPDESTVTSVSNTISSTSTPSLAESFLPGSQNNPLSVVKTTAASSTVSSSSTNVLTASSTVTADTSAIIDQSIPLVAENNPSSVVEAASVSSTISSSPTSALPASFSSSVATADATSSVDSATSLSGTQISSPTVASSYSTPSIPLTPPSTSSSKSAISIPAPAFNLGINPLILEVKIPSSISSSIVTSNDPRSFGPHSLNIPSYIPVQLSCVLHS